MKLTRFERLLLRNQHEILSHVDPDNADYHEKMQDIFEHGYELEFEWKSEHMCSADDALDAKECHFVIQTMSLYDALQSSVNALGDGIGVDKEAVLFLGFDGNNETQHMSYAEFLRERDGKFTHLRLGGDGMNSHKRMIPAYQRMLDAWQAHGESYEMSADQIAAVRAAGADA